MKSLYAATLYSHEKNVYIRLMLTAGGTKTIFDVEETAKKYRQGYTVHGVVFVCTTPDDVFMEV